MKLKDQSRNSILLLNRTSVIAGAIIICVVSLGLGYFIGFKTGVSGNVEVEQITEKTPKPKINEDKRVLEPLPPPPQPTAPVQKITPEKEEIKQPEKTEKKEIEKKAEEPKIVIQEQKQDTSTQKGFEKRIVPEKKTEKEPDKPKPSIQTEDKKTEKMPPKTKSYTIQLGAFPSKAGAEELKSQLKNKGINAYIISKDKDSIYFRVRVGNYSTKKEAERALISIEKQTGLKGFITTR
ncbi:MAG: SPOR domain-containing protein [Thermodesulfovibrionales bacterium]|nr:SPOR domain-containing protein [Thermodesulfovibrionales bacterium]